jgi:hypothetical protein
MTRLELAAHIRRLPNGYEKDRLTLAFQQKYKGVPDPSQVQSQLSSSIVYSQNPIKWGEDKLGEFYWSKQVEMWESVRDNRRTAIHSCHRVGKSMIFARIAMWWIDTHPPGEAIVVTSAHSAMQVKMALWRELSRVHSKGRFKGRMNQTELWMPMPDGREEMVAFGRKPADNDPTGFQGTYSKYVLALLDEACYVPSVLWDALDTLVGNEFSRIAAFGNPDDPTTEFYNVCRPKSGWNVIGIGYEDTPNFSGESVPQPVKDMLIGPTWVEEKRKKWGEDNPLYISKVLGQFPEMSSGGLIPLQWIKQAQVRNISSAQPIEVGVDVGGGGNKNIVAVRWGGHVRVKRRDQNPNTMTTLSNVLSDMETYNASIAKVDYIGIGHGAVDRAKEMAEDQSLLMSQPKTAELASKVVGVDVRKRADDNEHFVNLRAEGYWNLRERFEEGSIDIDPEDDDLAAQLSALQYKPVAGRIQIESKKDMRLSSSNNTIDNSPAGNTTRPSPDEADAVMLCFLPVELDQDLSFTW